MINLFLNSFTSDDRQRQSELDFCLKKNEDNPLIDNIIFLKSIQEDTVYNRPTFSDFFKVMKSYPSDINIIANNDIYFDDTIQLAERINGREAYALTRWELTKRFDPTKREYVDVIMFFNQRNLAAPPKSSQDVWIFRGGPNIEDANFGLGINGCDNKIAYLIKMSGYRLINPSYSIRCIHVHERPTIRNNYTVPRPYLFIEPCKL